MTQKLYYQTPIATECDAKALACVKTGDKYKVLTDCTVIFPEGGGQLSDKGFIGEAAVESAYEDEAGIWHNCDMALTVGRTYKMRLSLEDRLDHTEQHTGEHILSGLAKRLFNAVNVGFHMAEDYCTIDLDSYLNAGELAILEREANAAVRRNLPIRVDTASQEELAALELRKKAEGISGEARIVYIDGGRLDSCTCCGTHFESTGRVGAIKITDSQKYKAGTRLWFACGGRAVNVAADMQRCVTELARRFSTSREEMPLAVVRQGDELTALKKEFRQRTAQLCLLLAEKLIMEAKRVGKTTIIVAAQDGFSAQDLKRLTDCIVASASCIALVFGYYDETTYYRMACADPGIIPMNELCQAVNAVTGGKGGGNASFAQGSVRGRVHSDIIALMEDYLKKRSV